MPYGGRLCPLSEKENGFHVTKKRSVFCTSMLESWKSRLNAQSPFFEIYIFVVCGYLYTLYTSVYLQFVQRGGQYKWLDRWHYPVRCGGSDLFQVSPLLARQPWTSVSIIIALNSCPSVPELAVLGVYFRYFQVCPQMILSGTLILMIIIKNI